MRQPGEAVGVVAAAAAALASGMMMLDGQARHSRCRDDNATIAPMVAAIRHEVTVQPGGVIEIRSPELEPGSRAEVIVLLGSRPGPVTTHDRAGAIVPGAPNGAG